MPSAPVGISEEWLKTHPLMEPIVMGVAPKRHFLAVKAVETKTMNL